LIGVPRTTSTSQKPTHGPWAEALDALENAGGGTLRNLTPAGIYFGAFEDALTITIGTAPYEAGCPIVKGSLVEVPILSSKIVRSVSCTVPPGAGRGNLVTLARGGKTSFVASLSAALHLD